MTVQSTVNKITHLVSDIGQTEYIYDFRVDESDHMVVYLNDIEQSPGDYIVNDLGSLTGGTITISFTTALNDQLLILREMPLTQLLDYITYGKFPSATHEKGLDYGVMIDQQLQEAYSRAMRFPVYEDVDPLLPSPQDDYALVWEGNALVNKLYANSGGEVLIHKDHKSNGSHAVYDTTLDLSASALVPFDGQKVSTIGANSKDDGGFGDFIWNPSDLSGVVTIDPEMGVYVPPVSDLTGASGCFIRLWDNLLKTIWFGDVGDDSHNDTENIQATFNFVDYMLPLAKSVGIHSGKHLVDETLRVHSQGIHIFGYGGNYFFQNADQRNGTILKWTGGADTVMKVTPNLTNRPVIAPLLERFSIDGQSLATVGLRIEACTQGIFRDLYFSHFTFAALHTGGTDLVGFTGLNYTHSCVFQSIGFDQVFPTDGDALRLNGDNATGASTTVCSFYDMRIRHYNGDGIIIVRGDNNIFYSAKVGRPTAGSGRGIVFDATADTPSVNTNVFFYALAGEGGVHSLGTPTAVIPAVGNNMYGLSIDSGNPEPVIETGSNLYYHEMANSGIVGSVNTYGQNRVKIIGDYFDPIKIQGSHAYGINFVDGTYSSSQIRLKNNSAIDARNFADDADVELFRMNTSDEMQFSTDLRIVDGINLKFQTTTGSQICTTASQKMGLWGATPITQPLNIADTSGAALAALETEVNNLKQLIRDLGAMASS